MKSRHRATPENQQDRIIKDPQILAGKPIIKGTRLSVQLITDLLEGCYTEDDVLSAYPRITRADIEACRQYKATGAKLSNFTWNDLNALMDSSQQESNRQ